MAKKTDVGHEGDIELSQMVQTQDWHCSQCGRFLGKQAIVLGVIQVKCPNCKTLCILNILPDPSDT